MLLRRTRTRTGPAIGLVLAGVTAAGVAGAGLRRRARAEAARAGDAKRIVRRLLEEPWRGNPNVIDVLVSPGYVGHDPAEAEPVRGPSGVRASFERYRAAFPDARLVIEDQVADGSTVATRWTARGTHTGELAGISPTGREVTVSGLTISRLENGRVLEEWSSWDTLGLLVQLGAVPEAAQA